MRIKFLFIIIIYGFLSDSVIGQDPSKMLDPRNGKAYMTITVDSNTWMAENLNYHILGSFSYNDKIGYSDVYGRLYEWPIALVACPEGWHLPTEDEWNSLIEFLGGVMEAGKYLVPSVAIIDEKKHQAGIGFNSIPGGSRDPIGNYNSLEDYAYYWTSTEGDSVTARRKIISKDAVSVGGGYGNKNSAYSVRCIKD